MLLLMLQGPNPPSANSSLMLYERFGFEPDLSNDVIQQRLMEIQEQLRKKILTEMRLKEGAENLRKARKDKKSIADVNSLVKQANAKLEDLNQQLQEVNTYLLMTSTEVTDGSAGTGNNTQQAGRMFSILYFLQSSAFCYSRTYSLYCTLNINP